MCRKKVCMIKKKKKKAQLLRMNISKEEQSSIVMG